MADGVRAKFIAIAIALLLTSCSGSSMKTIAVIPKGNAHLFWMSVQAGAMAAGKKFGVNVVWNGPALETEYDRQIQILDSMIARHVDGIAIAAAERKALIQPIDRATSLGIPVAVFDSGVDSTNYLTFIATNNYEAGQAAARELAKLLGGKGTIAMIMHVPGSESTMDRERGFDDALSKEFPNMHVVARLYGQSDRSKAMAAAENILTAHPNLEGMFASAEPSSVGTSQAIKARGLGGKIKFVAFDTSQGLIDDLKADVISGLVVQDPFRMGFESVEKIVQKLQGKTPAKRIDVPTYVVEKQDLDKPEIKELLSPELRKY